MHRKTDFSGSVSQHDIACSLEMFSILLAQIFLLKRVQFAPAHAPGLGECAEVGSADGHFCKGPGKSKARKENWLLFCLHTGLKLHAIV